ncbi:MAG: hypothetical protein R3228_07380 [Halioglobus sp.]|nr:hypothetical protein [Halioglobus sp.]
MARRVGLIAAFAVLIAIFGINPLTSFPDADAVVEAGYAPPESGIVRQPNGVYRVRALTRMPGVKSHMVRWWFADYMQTTEHYKRWHPTAHVWMDWENKEPGVIIGASHLVHEFIGDELHKLRIQFVAPAEILGEVGQRSDRFIICARVGELERPIYLSSMCHIVRDTPWGAEMRSIFWLGHVAKRAGNSKVFGIENLLGNTALARLILVDGQLATDLMTHAIEEMGYLADFLPQLYREETAAEVTLAQTAVD